MEKRGYCIFYRRFHSLYYAWSFPYPTDLHIAVWLLKFMEKIILFLIHSFFLFVRNSIGCFNNPYVTYRRLIQEKTAVMQTVFIFMIAFLYFLFVSMIRTGIHHPLILTLRLNVLLINSLIGFIGMILLIYISGRLTKTQWKIRSIFILWSYTLIPTLVWFIATSILFLLFPPPRTLTIWGKIYSIVFIAFSMGLLYWKLILYYLTLRFSLKTDLLKIGKISFIIFPLVVVYALVSYQLKIFRIPFI